MPLSECLLMTLIHLGHFLEEIDTKDRLQVSISLNVDLHVMELKFSIHARFHFMQEVQP